MTDPEKARKRNEMIKSGNTPPLPAPPKLVNGLLAKMRGPAGEIVGRQSLQGRVASNRKFGILDDFLDPDWTMITRHVMGQSTSPSLQDHLPNGLHVSRRPALLSLLKVLDGEQG